MNEIQKSGLFAGAAFVLLLVGILVKPSTSVEAVPDDSGEPFWPAFKSQDVADLEIQTVNEKSSKPVSIQLVKKAGQWLIATHEKYPTDADNKLADAASAVSGLEKGAVVSSDPKDYELYGVVDPTKAEPGQSGIGTKVLMRSKSGDTLVSLIIGKEVPKTGASNASPMRNTEEFRYVRLPDVARVYQAKIQVNRLPTDFSEWINTDLLQLDQHNIKQVDIDNYSLKFVPDLQRGGLVISPEYTEKLVLHYNNAARGMPEDPNWKLDQFVFDPKKEDYKPVSMDKSTEELDVQLLNDMRLALDDLKIVDVRKKPDELSRELKLTGQPEARRNFSMESAGFFVLSSNDVKSKEGEVVVGMTDGVEYVLRFGSVVEARASAEKKEEKKKPESMDEKKEQEEKDKKTTRYLLVTARFNPGLIPPPQLELYPEGSIPGVKPPEEKKADEKPEEKKPEAKAEEKKPAEGKKDEQKDEGKKEPCGQEEAKKADDKAEAKKEPEKKEPEKKDPPKDEPKAGPKAEPKEEPKADDPLVRERNRITAANDIKQAQYNQKKVDGQRRVDALNKRFGDWYYIISDDVFKKIRLDRTQIIKTKKPEGAGNLPADFDILKGGLKPPAK